MDPQKTTALAVGATAALAVAVFKGPLWAVVLAFAGGVIGTQRAIQSA